MSSVVRDLTQSIQTVISTSSISQLNQSFLDLHRKLNWFYESFSEKQKNNKGSDDSDDDVDSVSLSSSEPELVELDRILTQYCLKPETVYIGYIGRAYLNMYRKRWHQAKNDALTLQLLDNLGGLKKGGTGITDTRVLCIAFHMLFQIYHFEGETERLKFCVEGAHANEPLFAFTNLQKAIWLMETKDMDLDENRVEVACLLNDVLERCPNLDDAYYVRSLYYKNVLQDSERSMQEARKAIELNPYHAKAITLMDLMLSQ